ncbi:hypothetical protein, partial [Tannerella forsythia]|uniref:hypothetical protein n=1 Tax=Tannerella forsythia TaxID=28112 RepID=UPI001C8A5A19
IFSTSSSEKETEMILSIAIYTNFYHIQLSDMRLFSVLLLSFVSARGYGKVKNEERKTKSPSGFFTYLHYLRSDILISTFYIRLTALRRSGYSFFPNASLRYTWG